MSCSLAPKPNIRILHIIPSGWGLVFKELLHDIFDKKILADDFSFYLHRPTATDDSFAPEGCDSFYALPRAEFARTY